MEINNLFYYRTDSQSSSDSIKLVLIYASNNCEVKTLISSSGTRAVSKRYGNAFSVTTLWISCVICPKDGRDITGGWRNQPGSIKARAVEPASAFCHSATATLCVSVDLCCESYLVLFVPTQSLGISSTMSKSAEKTKHLGESRLHYRLCIPPCKRYFTAGDTHSLCVVCLRAEQPESALEGADCPLCERLSLCMLVLRGLSLRRELSPAFLVVPAPLSPRRSGGCARRNRRWTRWREWRRASLYLLPFPSDPAPALWDWKPAPQFFPPRERARRSACLPPPRWTWRTSMSFVSCSVCTSILWTRISF